MKHVTQGRRADGRQLTTRVLATRVFASLGCAALCSALAFTALAIEPKKPDTLLSSKEFFQPDLYIPVTHQPLAEVIGQLPNKAAWEKARLTAKAAGQNAPVVYIDPRSATTTNMMVSVPLIPGSGIGNTIALEGFSKAAGGNGNPDGTNRNEVVNAVRDYVHGNADLLGIDVTELGAGNAGQANANLWHVAFPQQFQGVPVRFSRITATLSYGNLVTIGAETWGQVRGTSTNPRLTADEALTAGFDHAGGRSDLDQIHRAPYLEIVPMATANSEMGQGYRHVLTWTYVFSRQGEGETWQVTVDARDGTVLAFEDLTHYLGGHTTGGVYPITSTEICPTPGTCGTLQTDWPMPFADTGLAPPDNFTNSAGRAGLSADITTTLSGRYVNINDNCGAIVENGTLGTLDMGGVNGDHDCVVPPGASAGNTAASRTAFYELNKLIEMARGWIPGNTWLDNQLTANVNINQTCNANYNNINGQVNFYASGGGCRNTGELAGVFDHEWGHALDDNDTLGAFSNSSEGYADIVNIYRLHDSCVGHGFWETSDKGCGQTADGTGFNQNENQTGGFHCDTNCSGVRDADWARHSDNTPDTPINFVCGSCLNSSGPCGRQVHCAAAPVRQAAWDLVTRDLPYDRQTNFAIGNRLFYQGSGAITTWYSCDCGGGTSDGCGSGSGYLQWLAADDDNGNLNDGTPNMAAIFAAYDRHGIACSSPTPQDSGCAGGPTTAPVLSTVVGPGEVDLSWTAVAGATEYWVMRTEGHAGCDFGKARIATVAGTTYTDTEVAAGRDYYYSIAAASSEQCHTALSNCDNAVPTTPPPPPLPPPPPECTTLFFDTDFESDDGGFIDGASTCTTGTFIRGTPDLVVDVGVQTQPAGAAGGTFAWFTQNNGGGAGTDDVDGGTCETLSPVVTVGAGNTVAAFVDYFHGQRDGGGDPGDGFSIDLINADNGTVVANMVSFGDTSNSAIWRSLAISSENSPERVQLRIRATDAPAGGDLVEGGIDNVQICTEDTATPCTADVDCDNGLFCDGAETCDIGTGMCQAGTVVSCDDGVSCTVDACNEGTDSCDNTTDDSACDNGLFCDGAETCDAVNDCQAGTAVDCNDGVSCTIDACNEGSDACDNTPDNSACDNGLFCDGAETCDALGGCQAGSDPCGGQACDEAGDVCLECTVDADCDNGLFCDGAETCNAGSCQAGTPVACDDGVSCTDDSCNESSDLCESTANDANCDNGLFCDGTETCDAVNDCQAGGGDPCQAGETCDEAGDVCVGDCAVKGEACTENADCCDNKCRGKAGSMTCK